MDKPLKLPQGCLRDAGEADVGRDRVCRCARTRNAAVAETTARWLLQFVVEGLLQPVASRGRRIPRREVTATLNSQIHTTTSVHLEESAVHLKDNASPRFTLQTIL